MEESITFAGLKDRFSIEDADLNTFSPLTFAYIGDSVFDVVIRSIVVAKGNTPVSKMHNACSKIVCAASQAELLDAIADELNEEEEPELDPEIKEELKKDRFRLAVGAGNLIAVIGGTIAILLLLTLIVNMVVFVINDMGRSFTLFQANN